MFLAYSSTLIGAVIVTLVNKRFVGKKVPLAFNSLSNLANSPKPPIHLWQFSFWKDFARNLLFCLKIVVKTLTELKNCTESMIINCSMICADIWLLCDSSALTHAGHRANSKERSPGSVVVLPMTLCLLQVEFEYPFATLCCTWWTHHVFLEMNMRPTKVPSPAFFKDKLVQSPK